MQKTSTTNSRVGKISTERNDALAKFFLDAAVGIAKTPYCEECGVYIPLAYYRHATAHILPKKLFKSVAAHPANYLILGAGCGCHNKSHVWSDFQKMKVWPQAVQRFRQFYHLIPASEFRFIPQCLLNEVEPLDNFTFPTDL